MNAGARLPKTLMTNLISHQIVALLMVGLALFCAACAHSPEMLVAFQTEQQAKEHCPTDRVVWVDPQRGAYFLKGSASYGSVGAGRYACRGEVENAGMHASP